VNDLLTQRYRQWIQANLSTFYYKAHLYRIIKKLSILTADGDAKKSTNCDAFIELSKNKTLSKTAIY
jgi:hypothetical protein